MHISTASRRRRARTRASPGYTRDSRCSERRSHRREKIPGGDAGGATPVPIPNTEVKPSRADGTALVTAWESRSLPGELKRRSGRIFRAALFFYVFVLT